MLGSTNFRFRAGFALSLCAIAAAGILACVGSPSGRSEMGPGAGTIGDEKRTNPFITQPDFEAFVHLKENWADYKREHGIA